MSPINVEDILDRARNSSRVGDHEQTERLLKSYLAKVPDSRDARLLLGTAYAKEGKLSEAADEFIALLAQNPHDVEALNNAAVISRRMGKLPEALNYLMEAIDVDPVRAEFHYNVGNIHKQLNNFKAASMAYAKVIELDPGYVAAYNNLGTIYEQLREYDKAYGVFQKGLKLDPNNPNLHFNYGIALEATGRLEDAASEYRAAVRGKPGWLEPINNLGIILFKQGRHDKALATFNRILHADPFNAEAYNNTGVVMADQGRTQGAIKNYRRAIEVDPRYIKAVVNLERALEASGDFADALIELEKLVKLSPDSADIRNRLAGLYLKMERYPEALEQADAALQWEPDSVQALRIQGATQRVLGNDAAAQKSFEKILSIDPGNYNFLLDLADIHFRRKEYSEAEERLQAYLIRRPNDRNAKLLLGKLYAEMGNRTHAIQVFEELSKTDPNDAEALAAAAELHKEAGSIEKALRTADTLVNLQGKRATADDLTELNKSLEFYENAVTAYSSSVREMWDRNLGLLKDGEEEEAPDDDISLLMGTSTITYAVDEESEVLFTEDMESFPEDEDEGDMVFGEDALAEIPEEAETPQYRDPLDALAEDSGDGGRPRTTPPEPKVPPETEIPPETEAPPPQNAQPAEPPETPAAETSAPPPETPPNYPPRPPYGGWPLPPEEPAGGKPPLSEDLSAAEPELPEDDMPLMDGDVLDLSPGEEGPFFDEEIPEDVSGEEPLVSETVFPEEDFSAEDVSAESPEAEAEPETVSPETSALTPDVDSELAAAEESHAEYSEPGRSDNDESPEVNAIVEMLACLVRLTEELPEKQKTSFSRGKFPAVLESVIDSLRNLTIMDLNGSCSKPEDFGTTLINEPAEGKTEETPVSGGDVHGS